VDDEVIRGTLARRYLGKNAPHAVDVGGYQIAGEDVFKFQMDRANQLIQKKDYQGFNALLQGLGGRLSKWTAVPFTRDLFSRAPRTAAGGIKTTRKFIFQSAQWRKQLNEVMARVGLRKAAWLPAFLGAGGKNVAGWIMRHSTRRGTFIQSPSDTEHHYVVATNYARGVGRTKPLIQRALASRESAMRREFHTLSRMAATGKYTELELSERLN
jgi:hypothetical protein